MEVVAIVLLRLHQESMGEPGMQQLHADTASAFVKTDEGNFSIIISIKFQSHRKIKTCKYLPVSEIEL